MGVNILAICEHFGDHFAACFDPESGVFSMEQGDDSGKSTVSMALGASTTWEFFDFIDRIREIADEVLPRHLDSARPAVERIQLPHFVLPVIAEGPFIHSDERPFCSDETCPCHNEAARQEYVEVPLQAGLLTEAEAARLFSGRQL